MATEKAQKKVTYDPLRQPRREGFVSRWVSPSFVGSVAASLVLGSRLTASSLESLPESVLLAAGGFTVGFTSAKLADWVRWKLVRQMFTYQGWMFQPKSLKTKLWGVLLYLLEGDGFKGTYFYQRMMPKQPLPDLDATLDKWLSVTKMWMKPEEWEITKEAVEKFRKNEGPKVQAYLMEKFEKEVNWVSDYWLYAAYLSGRDPLAINSNYCGMSAHAGPATQMARSATFIYYITEYREKLEAGVVPPVLASKMVPLCMNFYKNMHGIVRIPGEHMDSIGRSNNKHVVIIRKGHFFKLDVYPKDANGNRVKLTTEEIEAQLERIVKIADEMGEAPLKIADLTAQNRTVWAKQREKLMKQNEVSLDTVESSMFVFCIQDTATKDVSESCKFALTGLGGDRWFDKCFNANMFENSAGGVCVEHSVIDAMVFAEMKEYWFTLEKYGSDGKLIPSGKARRVVPPPELLEWNLSGMEEDITTASKYHKQRTDDLDVYVLNPKVAKGEMKKLRVSPDGFVQMGLQLAYYRMHKETPKSYEPATGRMYALGRTETVHPTSEWSVRFVKEMVKEKPDTNVAADYLKKAVKVQTAARLEATAGKGCDRHLLGLCCASRELGMDMPEIFMDKSWREPFKLSTSQTPNNMVKTGIDQRKTGGGFGPSATDGYGVSYVFIGDENASFTITSWGNCKDTSSIKFGDNLNQAFVDMQGILSS